MKIALPSSIVFLFVFREMDAYKYATKSRPLNAFLGPNPDPIVTIYATLEVEKHILTSGSSFFQSYRDP
jgi:hypothetical protein